MVTVISKVFIVLFSLQYIVPANCMFIHTIILYAFRRLLIKFNAVLNIHSSWCNPFFLTRHTSVHSAHIDSQVLIARCSPCTKPFSYGTLKDMTD